MKRKLFGIEAISCLVLCSLFFIPTYAHAGQIGEKEAVDIAGLWYIMEYNSGYNSYAKETGLKLEDVKIAGVKVLLEDDVLVESNGNQSLDAYAYIVEFDPVGWICISSQEIMDPIIAFNVETKFVWRDPALDGRAFMISQIANAGVQGTQDAYSKGMDIVIHENWIRFRNVIANGYDPGTINHSNFSKGAQTQKNETPDPKSSTYVRWDTANWHQWSPYNDLVVQWMGVDVPVGCGALSYAVKMRFHEWPLRGEGERNYWEYIAPGIYVNVWAVFDNNVYDWDAMPLTAIEEPGNDDVANLMFEVGVALHSNYTMEGTITHDENDGKYMKRHFKYNKGRYEWSFDESDHYSHVVTSIHAGALPLVGNTGHVMLATGYRSGYSKYLYINSNGEEAWCNFADLPENETKIDESITYQHPESHEYVKTTATAPYSGWLQNPYKNLSQVLDDLYDEPGPDGERSHLWIKAGDYTSSDNAVTIDKYTDIRSYYGIANIRDRLFINTDPDNDTLETVAHIRINEGGSLIIK